MKFKVFFHFDGPEEFEGRYFDWIISAWFLPGQIGFRIFGIYVNLMWR